MTEDNTAAVLEPDTELEYTLAAAQNGEISSLDFLTHLSEAKVFILINQSVAEEAAPEELEPLILQGPDETPMLAVFTQSDRAAVITEQFPDFAFTLELDFKWVVANCGEAMGVVLNPGWNVGATLPPEAISHLRGDDG
ncbi:MAG: SseB family protein [Ectothiorhodospiraceae bacterium]|jgi:hypothetical protein